MKLVDYRGSRMKSIKMPDKVDKVIKSRMNNLDFMSHKAIQFLLFYYELKQNFKAVTPERRINVFFLTFSKSDVKLVLTLI